MANTPEILDNKTPNERFWVVIWLVVAITVIEALGQTVLKTARLRKMSYLVPFGASLYITVAILLYISYKYEGLGHVNLLWSCFSIIIAFLIGCMIFNEPHNRYTYIAMLCAFAGIYFAHRADELN